MATIEAAIPSNTELIALSAVADVLCILRVLQEVKDIAHLDQFDSVQIYRGGIDLLRVVNSTRHVGRSVYVELNDFRRRLQQV